MQTHTEVTQHLVKEHNTEEILIYTRKKVHLGIHLKLGHLFCMYTLYTNHDML